MTDIILLALSTLSTSEKTSEFLIEGTDCCGNYYGQLEPIIFYKYYLDRRQDIKVIALCTPETKSDVNNYSGMSSLQFFEKRVKEIREFLSATGNIEVVPVDIDDKFPISGIHETVKIIREENDRGKIWIDTHGGFRDISLSLEAVLSLLKVDKIIPEKIMGVRYDKGKAILIDQKSTFEMFDFVSGMNEFINTGSVDLLNEYYKDHDIPNLKPVLDAMNMISEGTEECNPNLYVEGLNELGSSINNLDTTDELLGIFAEYIKASYGVLLNPAKRTIADIIRRCVEKGLYQQALTLLETLMPEEFVKRHILYFKEQDLERIKNNYPKLKPTYEDNNNFVINNYLTSDMENPFFSNGGSIPETVIQEKEYIEILSGSKRNSQWRPSSNFLHPNKVVEKKVINLSRNRNERIELTVFTDVGVNEWRKVGKLLKMHKAMKRCRNAFNHCNSNRPDMKDIVTVLMQYVDLADEVFAKYSN